jgi:alkylation response protein AidB-like acyl-CoA dehydrogenase
VIDHQSLSTELRKGCDTEPENAWPQSAVEVMRRAGCFSHVIPASCGGDAASSAQRLRTYEAVSAGSLASALILTQHDAACELLISAKDHAIAQEVLRGCARGEVLATVGISQLTTSRRGGSLPALRAVATPDGYRLDGFMPWVTSANRADVVVTGAVGEDRKQILACVPLSREGIAVGHPFELLALAGSMTSEVGCDGVMISGDEVIRGPISDALQRRSPVKSLTVSFVGLGMCRRLIQLVKAITSLPDELQSMVPVLVSRFEHVRDQLYRYAELLDDGSAKVPRVELRSDVNDLVVRLASSFLLFSKGTGFTASHDAQRMLRESSFFLVWSAPTSVQHETLRRLWS